MKTKVTQREGDAEILVEVIAQDIKAISEAVKRMRGARLNDRAIVLLLHDASGIAKRDIKLLLDCMESLESTFLRKKP